jgi:ABC-type multidrug transport system fused ATPase/permease subunit
VQVAAMLKRMRKTNPWGFTKRWAGHIWYSFTIQLLVLQARNHFVFVGFWIFLLALLNGSIGAKYGIQYLFLDAEYLGQHGFWSFFFIGMGFGTFFLTWNMTLYLLGAHHFPFLAAIEQPFTKFCLNNFPIPAAFLLYYLGILVRFQSQRDDAELLLLFETALGLLIGLIAVIILYLLYFFYTNHDIVYYEKKKKTRLNLAPHLGPGYRGTSQELELLREVKWPVKTYLNEFLVTKRVRSVAHYNIHLLRSIFRQNHLNALLIQTLSIMVLAALGWLTDNPAFRLPAGASIFFLFSILTAILGAISFWFHAWRLSIFVVLLVLLNYLTGFDAVHRKSMAAGLDYQQKYAPYNYPALWRLCDSSRIQGDYDSTLQILERWKKKVQKSPDEKPQMVLVCTSGGGLRAAIWSMQVMRRVDSLSGDHLLDHTVLMSGASGGMLGMAYLRELSLQEQLGKIPNWRSDHYLDCMSQDLLNAPAFTLLAHDLFWPFGNLKINGRTYTRNRGTVFDKQLNENTGGLLNKPLAQYRDAEASAQIPLLYLTPAVVNDVRQMIISPQGVSFMMASPLVLSRGTHMEIDAVDFRAMFAQQGADQLSFLTALRMNATYPVILPSVFLPSKPEVEIMDAGIIDNYGLHTATRFLQVFESWIKANTSGILILQISTTPKFEGIPASDKKGVVSTLFNPLEIAGKWFHRQEFSQDSGLSFLYRIYGDDFLHHLCFEYKPSSKDQIKAAVSFHLTDFERKAVMNAIDRPNNQVQLEKFVHLFGKLSEQK